MGIIVEGAVMIFMKIRYKEDMLLNLITIIIIVIIIPSSVE